MPQTFDEGQIWLAEKAYREEHNPAPMSLGLYTNPIGTLVDSDVLANIIPQPGTGYAPIVLLAGDWVVGASGLVTRPDSLFTATSADWAAVTGAYTFDPIAGVAIHYMDAAAPSPMPLNQTFLVDWLSEIN